jgi:murein DD-endopeptidase MepM/ murein hydrolase activator NlpD
MRRLHPVLGYVRPHYGVDYAAPYGTKVVAIGPGKVVYVGYKGGFGRLVEIYHPEFGFVSQYGHLSRYAASTKVGVHVSAGETIGYVGTSGITTGPHVHFGIKKNDSYLNPERISFPRFATLNTTDKTRFQRYVSKLRPLFEEQEMGVVMVSLPEAAG